MRLELHPGAQDDLHEAVAWYMDRDIDVAQAFVEAVDSVLRSLESYPLRWPVHSRLRVHRVTLRRFPFAILYDVVGGKEVRILAVAHHKRRPEYWADRREKLL